MPVLWLLARLGLRDSLLREISFVNIDAVIRNHVVVQVDRHKIRLGRGGKIGLGRDDRSARSNRNMVLRTILGNRLLLLLLSYLLWLLLRLPERLLLLLRPLRLRLGLLLSRLRLLPLHRLRLSSLRPLRLHGNTRLRRLLLDGLPLLD